VAKKKQDNVLPEDLITLGDAARLKGYKDSSAINQLIRRGRIQRYEVYGKPLVSRSEVNAYNPDINKGGRPPKSKDEQVSKASRKGSK
jgi:hypothetical protein